MRLSKNQRVQCLATLFDGEGADSTGKLFSEIHSAAGHGQYVKGTVKRHLKTNYSHVLWDGDRTQLKSANTHLVAIEEQLTLFWPFRRFSIGIWPLYSAL